MTHLISHLPPDHDRTNISTFVIKKEPNFEAETSDLNDSESSNSVPTLPPPPKKPKKPARPKKTKKSRRRTHYKAINSPHRPATYNQLLPEGRISCYFCGFAPYSGQLVRFDHHMYKHTLEVPYRCDTCGRSLSSPEALEKHKKRHQVGREIRKFICRQCKSSFRTKDTLRSHVATHTTHADVQCPQCDKKFKDERRMVRHIRAAHTARALIKCVVSSCNEQFKRRDKYKRHLKKFHEGVEVLEEGKSHSCPFCDEVFKFQWQFERHAVQSHPHDVTQLFTCEPCDAVLANFHQFRKHCKALGHLKKATKTEKKGKKRLRK